MSMADYYDQDYGAYDYEDAILSGISVLHQTDKARLVFHGGMIAWFPKSISNIEDNDVLVYQDWFKPEWEKSTEQKRMTTIEGDFND